MTLQFILISTLGILVIFSVIMLMLYGYVWWKKKKHILRYWHNIYNNPQNGLVLLTFLTSNGFLRRLYFFFLRARMNIYQNILFHLFSLFHFHIRSDGSQMIPMRENPLYLMRDSQVCVRIN
jgi:hypothetical protein